MPPAVFYAAPAPSGMCSTYTQDQLHNSLQRPRPSIQATISPKRQPLLYRVIWNLQSLLQSLTRSKMFKLCNSNDEKAVEQHRLNGQYEWHFRRQNTIAERRSQQWAQRKPRSLVLARLQQHVSLCCHWPWLKSPPPASPCQGLAQSPPPPPPSTKRGVTNSWHPFWERLLTSEPSPSLQYPYWPLHRRQGMGTWPRTFSKMFIKIKSEIWGTEGGVKEGTALFFTTSLDALTSNNVHKIFQGQESREKQGIYSKKKREGKIKRRMLLKRKLSVNLPPPDTALIALVFSPSPTYQGCSRGMCDSTTPPPSADQTADIKGITNLTNQLYDVSTQSPAK